MVVHQQQYNANEKDQKHEEVPWCNPFFGYYQNETGQESQNEEGQVEVEGDDPGFSVDCEITRVKVRHESYWCPEGVKRYDVEELNDAGASSVPVFAAAAPLVRIEVGLETAAEEPVTASSALLGLGV